MTCARFADDGCRVLVTGDCGTSDHEALSAARARGIDTIVIDHHELPEGETAAYALVNSRRPDDAFPFKGLASCGVAFYLAAALRTRARARPSIRASCWTWWRSERSPTWCRWSTRTASWSRPGCERLSLGQASRPRGAGARAELEPRRPHHGA